MEQLLLVCCFHRVNRVMRIPRLRITTQVRHWLRCVYALYPGILSHPKKNINGWYKKSPNGRFLVGFPMLQWLQPNVVSAVMSVAHAVCSKNQLGPPQQIKTEYYQALRYTRPVMDPTILIVYQLTTLPMFAYIPVWL